MKIKKNIGLKIFLFAFLIRFAYLNCLAKTPLFLPFGLDPLFFHSWAKEISRGVFSNQPFIALPFYPYFLALLYKISHTNLYFVYFIQTLLSALSCSLIYFITKKIFNLKVAVIAGLISCLYGMLIFYSCILTGATLAIFLSLLIIFLTVRNKKLNFSTSLLVGLLLGASCLIRASNFLFFIFLVLYFFIKKMGARFLFVFSFAFFLFPVLVLLRNYSVSKELIFTAHSGINFYLANNLQAEGTFKGLLGRSSKDILENGCLIAEKKLRKSLTLAQVSDFWQREALSFIVKNPFSFFSLFFKKFFLFYRAKEIPDVENYSLSQKHLLPFLKLPFLSLRIILPLAIFGFFLTLFKKSNYRSETLTIRFFWLSQNLCLSLFWVNTRYRLLTVPIFIIFASFSLFWLKQKIAQRKYKLFLFCFGLILFLTFLVNIKKGENKSDIVIYHHNLGIAYSHQKEYDRAIKELDKALELQTNADTIFAKGVIYFKKEDFDKAKECFKNALEIHPAPKFYYSLGLLHQKEKRLFLAKEEYKKAVELNPHFLSAYYKLAQLYLEEGKLEMALIEVENILNQSPNSKEANELKKKIEDIKHPMQNGKLVK